MVRVTVGQTSQMTVGKLRTERPVYEQGFTFLVSNPETDTIEFKVCLVIVKKSLYLLISIYSGYRSKNQYSIRLVRVRVVGINARRKNASRTSTLRSDN